MAALAVALTAAGRITANVEYRRLGPGAYRQLLDDVRRPRAASTRRSHPGIPRAATSRSGSPRAGAPELPSGSAPSATSRAAARERPGPDAVREFLGDPPDYDAADAARMLPLGVPQLLVHGTRDDRIPIEHARAYDDRAGAECRLLKLEGADHFDVIDPRHPDFAKIVDALPR